MAPLMAIKELRKETHFAIVIHPSRGDGLDSSQKQRAGNRRDGDLCFEVMDEVMAHSYFTGGQQVETVMGEHP